MSTLLAQFSRLWRHSKTAQVQDDPKAQAQVSATPLLLASTHRAHHVGSLLRPANLYEKRALFMERKCSEEVLQVAEDDAIKHVVKLQKECGMHVITDGELRRTKFFEGVFNNLEGMTHMPERPMSEWKTYVPHVDMLVNRGVTAAETYYCTGKIKRRKPFYVDQFAYTKTLVPPAEVKNIKISVCSPSWFHQRHGSDFTYDKNVYKSDEEYFQDIAQAYREEFKDLYDIGCRHIQIDDPQFTLFCKEGTPEALKASGIDPETLLQTYTRAINLCTADRPKDLVISVHMCRGNFMGQSFMKGAYDWIADKVFPVLDVDAYYLEFDTDRAGGFGPLKYMPLDKVVILGLVTSKNAKLETSEDLKHRVHEAASIMSKCHPERTFEHAMSQLCISPQCGFASVWQGNPLTEEDEKNKLKLLVGTAHELWP